MRRILGDRQHVEPQDGALLGHDVFDLDALVRVAGTVARLQDVAVVADGDAEIAVGERLDVFRGIDVADVRADLEERVLGGGRVLGLLRVRIAPEIAQHHAHHLGRRVEHADPALGDLRGHRGIEHQPPAVERGIRHELLHHFLVVADAVGAPHVDHAVRVAGIVQGDALHQLGIHVLEIGELRLVERQVDARLDLPLEVGGGRHDHVEAARAGEELGLEGLVGVEIGGVDLDAGLLFEVRQGVRGEVVGPDVKVEDLA